MSISFLKYFSAGFIILASFVCHAQGIIAFAIGGANYTTSAGQLNVTMTVDAITPAVLTGPAANQEFRDDVVGAAFYGYYLSTAVATTGQTSGTKVNVQIRKGVSGTANRSYYLLGNGATTPNDQTDLTIAPAAYTTYVSVAKNTTSCGTNWSANGLPTGSPYGCTGATIVANLDITQFVKILFTDPPGTAIISDLEMIAVVQ